MVFPTPVQVGIYWLLISEALQQVSALSQIPICGYSCNTFSRIFISAATGNVGIGTDNPTYKLSVLGNIRSNEVVVETGWADYVFNEKYVLKPLSEIEKFIQLNKHLPGIPSALEIQKNGLPVGETQKMMMEKIEELTLYIIQLNKRIEELEKTSNK